LVIVSDSSIFIHLAVVGRFYLLKKIFHKIIIPKEVYIEVVEKGWGLPGSLETAEGCEEGWIISRTVVDKEKVKEISIEYKINYANVQKLIKSGYRIDKLSLKYFNEALRRISEK